MLCYLERWGGCFDDDLSSVMLLGEVEVGEVCERCTWAPTLTLHLRHVLAPAKMPEPLRINIQYFSTQLKRSFI